MPDESQPESGPLFGGFQRVEVTADNRDRLKALALDAAAEHASDEAKTSRSHVSSYSKPGPTQQTITKPTIRAESSSGRVLAVAEYTSESLIYIGEQGVPMGLAESMGLITRDSNGGLVATEKGKLFGGIEDADLPAAASKQPDAEPDAEPDATSDTPPGETSEAAWGKMAEAIGPLAQQDFDHIQARAVAGDIDLAEVAKILDESEDRAGQRVAAVVNAYEHAANAVLVRAHVEDPSAFRTWAESTDEGVAALREAIRGQLQGSDDGLESLGVEYNRALASLSAPGALAGYDGVYDAADDGTVLIIWTANDGVVWLKHPTEGTLPLARALMAGIVSRDA